MRRDHAFTVGERAKLDIGIASGTVEIDVGAVGTIEVRLDIERDDDVMVEQIGDTVSITDRSRRFSRSRSMRVIAVVPPRADLTVRGASVDVVARGAHGIVRCDLASGDLDVDEAVRVEASSASGNIRIGTIHGDAGFTTTSGDLLVHDAAGRLNAQLTSGAVHAGSVGGGIQVGTASGNVRIDRCDGSDIQIRSVSGNIRLGLPAGIRVEPDISTMSGKVLLPSGASPVRPGSDQAERRSVRVRLRSLSGDIRIDRVGQDTG